MTESPKASPEEVVWSNVDWIEVNRQSFELGYRHGRDARHFATKLALKALSDGKADEHAFWKAVEQSLTIRGSRPESL